MNMDLTEVVEALNLTGDISRLNRDWELSSKAFKENGIFFLQPDYIWETARYLRLDEEIVRPILDAAAILRGSVSLQRLAWHCYFLLFETEGYPESDISAWPSLNAGMHEYSGLFQAVVCLSGIRKIRAFYDKKAIPPEIIVETYADLELWMREYRKKHGVWGFDQLGWLTRHLSGRLYRLGRLQFIPGEFTGKVSVFRSSGTGKLAVLSESGVVFREDGMVDGTNGIFDEKARWEASFTAGEKAFRGNPITPAGLALRQNADLSAQEWVPVLARGDVMLDVHIPAGEKLKHEACLKSYDRAMDFFHRYFPEIHFKGFMCESWLLGAQLKRLLPDSSNIVAFQSDYFRYPIRSDAGETLGRVFDEPADDFSRLPRDTPLRAAIVDDLLSGHQVSSGAGFILASMPQDQCRNDLRDIDKEERGTV